MSRHTDCGSFCMHMKFEAVENPRCVAYLNRYELGGVFVLRVFYEIDGLYCPEALIYGGNFNQLNNAVRRLFDFSENWRCMSIKGGADLEAYECVHVVDGIEVVEGACGYGWN